MNSPTLSTLKVRYVQMTIEERQREFIEKLRPYIDQYGRKMLNEFFMYWTEHNEGGKKMRYEMQKVFNLQRRLITWYKKSLEYGKLTRKNRTEDWDRITKDIHDYHSKHPG